MKTRTRLLICDDQPLMREGIKAVLEHAREIEIVGEACNGREAVSETKRLRPEMILMDVSMPEVNGLEATIQIKEFDKNISILIMTMHDDEEIVMRCLSAGAAGYLLKDAPLTQLAYAVEMLRTGHQYLDPGVTRSVNEYLRQITPTLSSYDRLSAREREVLELVSEGLSVKEIAARLTIGAKTVDTHKYNLMTKLGIHNAAGLTRYAIQNKPGSVLPTQPRPRHP